MHCLNLPYKSLMCTAELNLVHDLAFDVHRALLNQAALDLGALKRRHPSLRIFVLLL